MCMCFFPTISVNGKAKNPGVQSTRLDVLADLHSALEVSSDIREGMPQRQDDELTVRVRESNWKAKASFFHVVLWGLLPESVAPI